jgi:hypothetical protein
MKALYEAAVLCSVRGGTAHDMKADGKAELHPHSFLTSVVDASRKLHAPAAPSPISYHRDNPKSIGR